MPNPQTEVGAISGPLVSVIVPAFNACRWIERTLLSVRNQTVSDIEIIVVDDGSTDETAEIARQVALKDNRIRILRQENRGVAAARNFGASVARSEFIAMIDADDLWHPRRLEAHLSAFGNGSLALGMVYSPARIIDEFDNVISDTRIYQFNGNAFKKFLAKNPVGNGSGLTMRASSYREIGGYDETLRTSGFEGCEDKLIQHMLALRFETFCVPEYLIGYRKVPGNMSSDLVRMARSRLLASQILSVHEPSAAFDLRARFSDRVDLVRSEIKVSLNNHKFFTALTKVFSSPLSVSWIIFRVFYRWIANIFSQHYSSEMRVNFYSLDPARPLSRRIL